ncbi:cyclin-L1-1 isoform X2 [Ziziphus jujuba]|uniref:B-like cyclin n=1 Tax=Ziziphus jujuba TaxID=326968 RepID=A0ABM3IBR1_ZIZJJ|nr:cyclin-L1-1 isoform X2 [Ziziphus jujuba]
MIYTAVDTFYLTDEQLANSPSRKDGIDEATETNLRIYGCHLIQESGILLKLDQAVMATGQVLFHRFYCKKSFARFNVKKVAVSCVWLASKLEECPRKARQVIIVFHRMECRRDNLPIDYLDPYSKKYSDLKMELSRTERHILKEMGFICHVEHPHKFISNYLATLEIPPELRQLRQEAWNLANDRSEVVACGVVYAAARRFQVPLPENPPWWKAFNADKSGIDEVCRVLAHLYSLPEAQYIPVCKDGDSFTFSNKSWDSRSQPVQEVSQCSPQANDDASVSKAPPVAVNLESDGSKGSFIKVSINKLKESKKSDDESKSIPVEGDLKEEPVQKSKSDHRSEIGGERNKERESEREREREGNSIKARDCDRGRGSDRERKRKQSEMDRDKIKEQGHRSRDRKKDLGNSEKSRHHSSRDRDYRSYSSWEKDRHRHHSYA